MGMDMLPGKACLAGGDRGGKNGRFLPVVNDDSPGGGQLPVLVDYSSRGQKGLDSTRCGGIMAATLQDVELFQFPVFVRITGWAE